MAKALNSRFYKTVSTAKEDGGYIVLLDQYRLKTPGKKTLLLPRENLAQLIANEWEAQGEKVDPSTMPVTRLLNVAIERTPARRAELIAEARKYASTDQLCYRSAQTRLYFEYQAEHWDPVLDWAAGKGAALKTTESLAALEQDATSLDAVAAYAAGLDDIALTLFVHLTSSFGSAVLAMAVHEFHLDAVKAYSLSRLDEIWQIKQWGQDELAAERTDMIEAEIVALCAVLET